MRMRYSGMTIFIQLAILASISFSLAEESGALAADQVAGDTIDATAMNTTNTTVVESAVMDGPADVRGIWKISLSSTEITMALNQSGDALFGLAKFEGDKPWNAAVAGSVSGKQVHLAMGALQEDAVASMYLGGTLEDESMRGTYVRSDSSGNAAKAEFVATRISPDTSGYTPATVEAISEAAEPGQPKTPVAQPEAQAKKSKYRDVLDLAKGIDPNIMPRMAAL